MKVCPLTRISRPAPDICPNVPLTRDDFYMERGFRYYHGLMTVILVGSNLQVLNQGFMIGLEYDSLAS